MSSTLSVVLSGRCTWDSRRNIRYLIDFTINRCSHLDGSICYSLLVRFCSSHPDIVSPFSYRDLDIISRKVFRFWPTFSTLKMRYSWEASHSSFWISSYVIFLMILYSILLCRWRTSIYKRLITWWNLIRYLIGNM